MISMRIHRSGPEILLAACDKALLGKTLEEGRLKLFVDERFYGGDDADPETLAQNLRLVTMANIVGEEAVGAAMDAGFVDSECIMRLEGVPYAQMVLM